MSWLFFININKLNFQANATLQQVRFNLIKAVTRQISDVLTSYAQFLLKFNVKLVGNKTTIKIGMCSFKFLGKTKINYSLH